MIENPSAPKKHDRLFAFFRAFPLVARPSDTVDSANLLILADSDADRPTHILYRPRAGMPLRQGRPLALAELEFGGVRNPLVGALPPEIIFGLAEDAHLKALSDLVVAERQFSRCGGGFIGQRLCEIIVVYAMRRAIADGTVNAGLLAGLAHPELHPCLVAMHDDPARAWRIGDLTRIAGMSRNRFIRIFSETIGRTPMSYLNEWRLILARVMLSDGISVKVVAGRVGFGSASAFSRAFSRHFGTAPSKILARGKA